MDDPPTGRHDCDAVILGAGLAGLVAGGLLSATGLSERSKIKRRTMERRKKEYLALKAA